jgi:D-galactarolactone isomerase
MKVQFPLDLRGACDCHMHVYEHGYALAPTATFTPPHAPVPAYQQVQRQLGLERVIVVQPTGYGFDNACTLDAIARLGAGARGIVVVAPEVADAELQRLHAAGIRGVRFFMLPGGVMPWSAIEPLAARVAPLGWNINLQLNGRDLPQHEAVLARLAAPLVVDHIGKFIPPVGIEDAAFGALCRLLDGGNGWVKLSAPYESSRSGRPDYADVAPLARELAARYPQRCLWASNWPHPNVVPAPPNPEIASWAFDLFGDDAARRRILVENPAALYGF